MELQFSVKDIKTGHYNTPFSAKTTIDATRSFCRASLDDNTNLYNFPSDYELYEVGNWDGTQGKFVNYDTPKFIMNGIQAKTYGRTE